MNKKDTIMTSDLTWLIITSRLTWLGRLVVLSIVVASVYGLFELGNLIFQSIDSTVSEREQLGWDLKQIDSPVFSYLISAFLGITAGLIFPLFILGVVVYNVYRLFVWVFTGHDTSLLDQVDTILTDAWRWVIIAFKWIFGDWRKDYKKDKSMRIGLDFRKWNVSFYLGRLTIEFGWFQGEPFNLFQIALFQDVAEISVSVVRVQVLKLVFDINWNRD